jgi:excisionase family DNA binding protein
MTDKYFSTTDLSKMLNVGKSSIKRWTEAGSLKCIKTPGGHRKFRTEDIVEFLKINKYDIPLQKIFDVFNNDEGIIRQMIRGKEYHSFTSVCFSAALKSDKEGLVKLFLQLYRNGMALTEIFDRVLLQTLKRLSEMSGVKISSLEFELALQIISNALIVFGNEVIKPANKKGELLCVGPKGQLTSVELSALNILLESEGFSVIDFQAPLDSPLTLELITLKKPKWLCVWLSTNENLSMRESSLDHIVEMAKSYGGKVLLAGDSKFLSSLVPEDQEIVTGTFEKSIQSLRMNLLQQTPVMVSR